MYEVIFYRNAKGEQPVFERLVELKSKNDKDSRIKLKKIGQYIELLKNEGTFIGEPYVKHLDGEIWELRPSGERILFAHLNGKIFMLLHCFTKSTNKTPKRDIERAKLNLKDAKERIDIDEQ